MRSRIAIDERTSALFLATSGAARARSLASPLRSEGLEPPQRDRCANAESPGATACAARPGLPTTRPQRGPLPEKTRIFEGLQQTRRRRPRCDGAEEHALARSDAELYFLCRCRFRSLRCLCFRIFFRRFLITLPNGLLLDAVLDGRPRSTPRTATARRKHDPSG